MSHTRRVRALIVLLAFTIPVLVQARDPKSESEQVGVTVPAGIPPELWAYFIPKENRMTAAKVELGRQLFFDKALSADGTVSCSTCHDPQRAFADGKAVAEGINGRRGTRNSPSLLNAMFNSGQFWDGRAATLEAQAILPLINPDEMGNASFSDVVKRLQAVPQYLRQFRDVFGGDLSIENVGRAIAAYERTLLAGNSSFDRFVGGDRDAMSSSAQRGLSIFRGRASCARCHTINSSFPFFSDQNYRNTGVATAAPSFNLLARRAVQVLREKNSISHIQELGREEGGSELGRFLVSGHTLDIGSFRTPSLRNVELTAPYFHNGTAATLREVVQFYMKGGGDDPRRDWELQPVSLNDSEQEDLIEFLKSLTSDDHRPRSSSGSQP
jgi:cytochrome c peroxidase